MKNKPIILSTINIRYVYTSFALRYLLANMGSLKSQTRIMEFFLTQTITDMAESLLREEPGIIGFSIYIWNIEVITGLVRLIKHIRPDIIIVVGGPEISYEYADTELFFYSDFLIQGEGEFLFAELVSQILAGKKPKNKVISGPVPELTDLVLPYGCYTDTDIADRIIFVETSRGCPFACEFCISSLDNTVREFPLAQVFAEIDLLLAKGVRQMTFVDRTFNLRQERVEKILTYFLAKDLEDIKLYFEIVPDQLQERTLELFAEFPPEALKLEVGIQTFNNKVNKLISRNQNVKKTVQNLGYLLKHCRVFIHADLIVGLPGESVTSIGSSFEQLLALKPQKIQVGILKRLKGTAIARHASEYDMVFSKKPPYEIMQTGLIDFMQMQRIKRFSRYFHLYYNSNNFPHSLPLLWKTEVSAFKAFMEFSDFFWTKTGKTHQLSLLQLFRYLFEFLIDAGCDEPEKIAAILEADYSRKPGRYKKLDLINRDIKHVP
ncbi:DUF4080 domain-containing protein [Candidatus Riflebacteria bacterium]